MSSARPPAVILGSSSFEVDASGSASAPASSPARRRTSRAPRRSGAAVTRVAPATERAGRLWGPCATRRDDGLALEGMPGP